MPPKKQPYIPGLTARPDDADLPPSLPRKTERDILIDDFLTERKNATMCLYEHCAQKQLPLLFKQEAVEYNRPGMSNLGSFCFRAVIDEMAYPQGIATTKKDAKNEASKLAFRALVGLNNYIPEKIMPELNDLQFAEVRDLSDLCVERGLVYDEVLYRDTDGQYICTVIVTSFEPFVRKNFKRDQAVVQAHADALLALGAPLPPDSQALTKSLQGSNKTVTSTSDSTKVESRFPDSKIAAQRELAVYKTMHDYLQILPPEFDSYDHNIAAIFIANNSFPGVGKIVAFGTGNSTIAVETMTLDGRCVVDSTCVVTARRGFKRYLAQEMINCYANDKTSIFEQRVDNPARLKLKSGFSFHLYVSHPIDGDYKESLAIPTEFTYRQLIDIQAGSHEPNFLDPTYGLLRCKNEQGMFELTDQTPDQSSLNDVKLANEMFVMTASDKLLLWNIVGLQGAAFTHFTDPVYLSSITLGFNPSNDHGHLSRAVCCRVYHSLSNELPAHYKINHPVLNIVPTPTEQFRTDQTISRDSINWNCHDKLIEVTEGLTGRSHPLSPFKVSAAAASRQCKAGLHLKWFRDICAHNKDNQMLALAKQSHLDVKSNARDYQAAKNAFMDHCMKNHIGKWIHAPPQLNTFNK